MPSTVLYTHTTASMSTTSAAVLAVNGNRKYALVQNNGPATVWLKIGATAVANEGIRLDMGGSFEMAPHSGNLDTRAINGITADGAATMLVTEAV